MFDNQREIQINLNTGTIVRFFLFVLLIIALYYISDVLLVIMAAVVIASAIEPAIRRLKRRRVHRVVSVVLIYILMAVIFVAVMIFFMPMVVNDVTEFFGSMPKYVSIESLWSPVKNISTSLTGISTTTAHIFPVSEFFGGLRSMIVGTSAGAFQTASFIFGGVFSFILIVVLSFYLAVQEEGVDDFLRIISPVKHHEYIIDLWKRSQRKIALWLQGQVILGLVIGILVYVVLKIVGIPHALILAVFAGVFEIIPVFGPIISSVPALLLAFTEMGWGTGLLLMVLYLIIYQFESQFFYPLVVKKIVGISPIIVILSLVIGAKLAGILGAIIAVPLSAAFMEYIHDIEKYKKAEVAERETVGKNGRLSL